MSEPVPPSPAPPPDAFEVLGAPPRPWLDAEALKADFLRQSTPCHPDRVHALSEERRQEATRRFAELNAAYLHLRDPRDRLNLLIEREAGAKPKDIQRIPPGTMDLFVEVGQLCREADVFLAALNEGSDSPILRAGRQRQKSEWLGKIEVLIGKVREKQAASEGELQRLDAKWMGGGERRALLPALEDLARLFSYIARWSSQLEERRLHLG